MIDLPIIASDNPSGDRARGDYTRDSHACGPCTACCVWLTIPAGQVSVDEKPAGVACPQVRGGCGCSVYSTRPLTCREFRCTWLADEIWPPSWRPHESGLLCLRETLDGDLPAAVVYEIRADALLESPAAEILDELLRTTTVVAVVTFEQRRLRLSGRWRRDPAESPMRRPHFAARDAFPADARVLPT